MAKLKKKKGRRKRSLQEKIWIGIAVVLALSMVASSLVALFQ